MQRCGLVGISLDENRAFLEVTPRDPAKSTFRAVRLQVNGPTHVYRCTRTVPKQIELEMLGLALSEKQIPQIVENNQSGTERMEPLEATEVRPRQVRYQAALKPMFTRFSSRFDPMSGGIAMAGFQQFIRERHYLANVSPVHRGLVQEQPEVAALRVATTRTAQRCSHADAWEGAKSNRLQLRYPSYMSPE